MKNHEYSEEVQRLLKQLVDHFDAEDRSVRDRQILVWRKLKLMWENFSQIYYSETAHDWRIWDSISEDDSDQSYYDKPINVFRAYLETIIAALSGTVPPIKCYPDDADNPLDLTTAKAGDKIAQLIFRHNNAQLLWLHGLFIYMTEGLMAAYSYPKTDKSYGTYKKEKYEDFNEYHESTVCPNCGFQFEDNTVEQFTNKLENEYDPSDVALQDLIVNDNQEICPQCAQLISPEFKQETLIAQRLAGITDEAKTRQCIEVMGGLFVKVPVYARAQEDCLYLGYSYETHYANILGKYPWLKDKIHGGDSKVGSSGVYSGYEEWARLSPQYRGEYPRNNRTCRNWWFRTDSFNIFKEESEVSLMKHHFPNGVRTVFVNDIFAEAENECIDDCWTLSYNPLADYLHHDPVGLLLTSVQEITNDLISLTIQTIEHGITQTFADPGVVNFNAYRNSEITVGGLYPATPKSGRAVGDAFHEVKTSTLSGEILPFFQQIQALGQLASGALPSLFGGQMNESKTASEYSMSRAQALQRQQNTWKVLTNWWKTIFGKVIPAYIKTVVEDEKDVQRDENGNFINVFIRKSELEGKIGKIELEANENLPITWNQRKDVVTQLLQTGNPEILAILGSPENLPIIREAIGLDDFYVPGEDDRNKQYEEINLLVNSEPIVIPPSIDPMMAQDPMMMEQMSQDPQMMQQMQQQMQPQELPSVEIDPEIDNNEIEFEVCRKWLISEAGRLAKVENPNGYKNVLLHAKMHLQVIQQNAMIQAMQGQNGAAPGEKGKENTNTPIKEESDVNVSS